MNRPYDIAAYYFPNYHPDVRNANWHSPGWTEWKLVKNANPRFPGHQQPKVPLWGFEDESDPKVMNRKIRTASAYGIKSFIFDWYWYEDGPFLQRCLEEGFLKAKDSDQMKFAIMWANHDWLDIHPATASGPYEVLSKGEISEKAFFEATEHMIKTYFAHPSYWRVDDGLYLSIYELNSLIQGLGGATNCKVMLNGLRSRVRDAGLGELHLNAVVWGIQILPGEKGIKDPNELLRYLGFDSVTSYIWVHHYPLNKFPKMSYQAYSKQAVSDYATMASDYSLPYHPNITMGWDPSPRTDQNAPYMESGYPYTPILTDNTPEAFREALIAAKKYLDSFTDRPPFLTINAWNEWTEGSYLEPDDLNGMAYLEAIRSVFID